MFFALKLYCFRYEQFVYGVDMYKRSDTVCRQCVHKVLHDSMNRPGCFSLGAMIAKKCEQQECDFSIQLTHTNVNNCTEMDLGENKM